MFKSSLLELIEQSKWEENVRSQRQWSSALYEYVCALVIASCATLSGPGVAGGPQLVIVDMLQGAMMLCESVALILEGFQLVREGCSFYFTRPWNLLDVVASGCLVAGGMCPLRVWSNKCRCGVLLT